MFDWIVGKKLDQIGRQADPDRAFVVALKKQVADERPRRYSMRWKLLAGSFASMSCLFVGTGAYAYTSDNVLPGDALYVVREGLEKAEMALAPTPAIRAMVTIRQMQRRVHEQELMNVRKRPIDEKQMQRFAEAMEVTIDETDRLDETEKEQLDRKTAKLEERFTTVLNASKDREQTKQEKERIETMLERQTARLQERVKKLEVNRRERYRALLERRPHASGTPERREAREEGSSDDDSD